MQRGKTVAGVGKVGADARKPVEDERLGGGALRDADTPSTATSAPSQRRAEALVAPRPTTVKLPAMCVTVLASMPAVLPLTTTLPSTWPGPPPLPPLPLPLPLLSSASAEARTRVRARAAVLTRTNIVSAGWGVARRRDAGKEGAGSTTS